MAEISKIKLPDNVTYDIKDATARSSIPDVSGFVTTSNDGSITTPVNAEVISVNGKTGTVVLSAGDVNAYTKAETDQAIADAISAIPNLDNGSY